jgi:hypothetical protein
LLCIYAGCYVARNYDHLDVPTDVRDLFQLIEAYKPQEVELGTPLHCIIPDYIPAMGAPDVFLKVSANMAAWTI